MFVSFNIDLCQSISLYYNDKLDVENEKDRLDKYAVKSKLNEQGWQIPCKIATYISIFYYGWDGPLSTRIEWTDKLKNWRTDNNNNIQNCP